MGIRRLLLIIIAVCSLGGLALSLGSTAGYRKLDIDARELGPQSATMKDLSRVKLLAGQWLVACDLVLTERQTYLANLAGRQAEALATMIREVAGSPLAIDHAADLREATGLVEKIAGSVHDATRQISGPRGAGFDAVVEVVDADSTRLVAILDRVINSMTVQSAAAVEAVDRWRWLLTAGVGAGVLIYLLAVIAVGKWAASALARPVQELTEAAQHAADANTDTFEVAEHGPAEVRKLARSIRTFIRSVASERNRADLAAAETEVARERERVADMKSRFVMMASHEFRTPLAVIQAAAESLRRYRDRMDSGQREERFDRISQGVQQMTGLIDDVLIFGKSHASALSCVREPVDLESLCREALHDARVKAGPGCELTMQVEAGDSPPLLDPALIRRTLSNLLDNAVKYSPNGGRIQLAASYRDDVVTFRVSDEGIGISADDQALIFEPFHRGHNVGTIPGSGLGLAILQDAVEAQGGSILVESDAGRGATFVIDLPAQDEQADQASAVGS